LIHWAWLVAAFAAGAGAAALLAYIASLPLPPGCTAVLRSGERCRHDAGHSGPHETIIYDGSMMTQQYVWEDPKAGLHPVGFFRRG